MTKGLMETSLHDIELATSTVKSKSRKDIEEIATYYARRLSSISALKKRLRNVLGKSSGKETLNDADLAFTLILACVLADIGGVLYRPLRELHIKKIRSIASAHGIDYEELLRLTEYSDEIAEVLAELLAEDNTKAADSEKVERYAVEAKHIRSIRRT